MDRIEEIKARCEVVTKRLRYNDAECDRTNFGCMFGKSQSEAADIIETLLWGVDCLNSEIEQRDARGDIALFSTRFAMSQGENGRLKGKNRKLKKEINRLFAERDAAVKQMCQFCRSIDKKAGIEPVCAASCAWRGVQK